MAAQTYKRTMSGSVGAGMKSLFGESGRRFYTLEHKISSKYHKAGETQQIIVDQIELGRDSTCQVRFDESFTTVSRRHAAIVKDGDNWKLVQLSQTNSTYLNGHKVEKEWYLQNGDEIQLSTNGPKLGFITTQGEKGLVKSIGLTARLNLFRQQALRPYKKALTALASVFVIVMLACGFLIYNQQEQIISLKEAEAKLVEGINSANAKYENVLKDLKDAETTNDALDKKIKEISKRLDEIPEQIATIIDANGVPNSEIEKCLPNIFYIQTVGFEIMAPDGTTATLRCGDRDVPSWSGTGFMLNDGKFVTARHVTEGWYFWQQDGVINEELATLNLIANNRGKVVAHFIAVSSSGEQLTFTSDQFVCNRSGDYSGTNENGWTMTHAKLDNSDYAYIKTDRNKGLAFDNRICKNLERGTKLTVLGFPLGLGVSAEGKVDPIYGSGIVASKGLNQGVILTTDTNYEQGNSGGPVFYTDTKGNLVVVGIVSAGAGRATGFVVPISSVY